MYIVIHRVLFVKEINIGNGNPAESRGCPGSVRLPGQLLINAPIVDNQNPVADPTDLMELI